MAARFKIGRSLLVAGVLTAVAVPATAAAAYAGTPPHPHNPPGHHHGTHATSHHHGTHAASVHATALTTVVPDANIRNKTTTARHSRVVATLHARGSEVQVTCHKTGMPVNGDSTWYKTVVPAHGYIAAAMLDHPTTVIPLCAKKS